MTDPGFIDPFGDDSDLLQDPVANSDPDVLHLESPLEGEVLKGLPEMTQNTSWLSSITNSVLEQENANVETEAIVYAVSEIIGNDRMEELMAIARHRQRAQMWEQICEVFELLVDATPAVASGNVGPAAAIVAQKSAETLYQIAQRCRTVHQETYEIKKGEYDEARVSHKKYSFNFWVSKAPDVLDSLKHKISVMKNIRSTEE